MDHKASSNFERSSLMRICHLITTIERGGAEKQLLLLVRQQIKHGNEVTVISLKGRPDLKEDLEEIGAKVDPSPSKRAWVRKIGLVRKLLSANFDIIHAHLPVSELVASWASSEKTLIVTRHNTETLLQIGRAHV